jgi:hypothetical protein
LAATPVGDLYLPADRHPERLELLPLDVFQCGTCGHVQLCSVIDPEYLYRQYIYTTSSSLGLPEHFLAYAKTVCQKLGLRTGGLVVEIGSNDGTMLRGFQRQGMRVVGVDPAKEIAARATEEGVPTVNDFFTVELAKAIVTEHGRADLFIANNVLANVPSPRDIFVGVMELLGKDGVIVFETGYLRYLAEDCVFDNIYHEHIDYYSIRPLVSFFEELGLQLFDVDVSDSKGSSIRCYVQQRSGKRMVTPVVAELCERELTKGYGSPAPYAALSKKLDQTKASLRGILKDLKANGKTVAGFGASVGVTTVLYHFELAGLVDYLLDDNTTRQGLFSPGLGLEVKSPSILAGPERPDVVLLLAWRYAKPITRKYQPYAAMGGRFLTLLPEIAFLD